MSEVRWSHEGWYWFCPILWSDDQEVVAEKHWTLYPLFKLACWCDQARIFVTTLFVEDYEPAFMFKLRPIPRKRP